MGLAHQNGTCGPQGCTGNTIVGDTQVGMIIFIVVVVVVVHVVDVVVDTVARSSDHCDGQDSCENI